MTPRLSTHSLVILIVSLPLVMRTAQGVSFSDGQFESEDWTPIIHVRDDPDVPGDPPLTSTASLVRQSTGGNPAGSPYFRSLIDIQLGDIVHTTGIYVAETYDPRERAIASLNYSYDANHFAALGSTDINPALLQDGKLYLASSSNFSGLNWFGFNRLGLVETDFVAVDFWFTGATLHPDFSAFGDPIQFGYSVSNRVALGAGFREIRKVDNWSVNITQALMSDIHGDGVDGADLDFWKAGYGIAPEALLVEGDFDRNLAVNGQDFLKWQREFGGTAAQSALSAPVPEPSTAVLVMVGLALTLTKRRPPQPPS